MVERCFDVAEVNGSIPFVPTSFAKEIKVFNLVLLDKMINLNEKTTCMVDIIINDNKQKVLKLW